MTTKAKTTRTYQHPDPCFACGWDPCRCDCCPDCGAITPDGLRCDACRDGLDRDAGHLNAHIVNR